MEENNKTKAQVTADATPWMVLLTIVLLVGKTVGWWSSMSWWLVFLPLWLPFAVVLAILGIFLVVGIVAFIVVAIMALLER